MNLWDTLNEYVPENPYYDDGQVTVGPVSVDLNGGSGGNAYDPYWMNFDELVADDPGEDNLYVLNEYRDSEGLPWGWIAAGGVVLVLLYAMRR